MARYRLVRPWTPEADEALILLFKGGRTIRSIAAKLRRTEGSIRARANFLGLSGDRRTEVANSKQK